MKLKVILPAQAPGLDTLPGDGPLYATVTVTSELLTRIEQLAAFCDSGRLSEIVTHDSVDTWCTPEFAARHRIGADEMVVGPDAVWFRAPAHQGRVTIATQRVNVGAFVDLCRDNVDSDVLYIGVEGQNALPLRSMTDDRPAVNDSHAKSVVA